MCRLSICESCWSSFSPSEELEDNFGLKGWDGSAMEDSSLLKISTTSRGGGVLTNELQVSLVLPDSKLGVKRRPRPRRLLGDGDGENVSVLPQ
mmetsp:Transcript_45696/g.106846  ORF Transcript_45696/g.106846 Transcript_45696/m.106846 type:complete len:93 (-) Transcript_45696:71-349(-)